MARQELGPNQKRWIEALRSGEFKQCKGMLSDRRGFCCLGVACKVFDVPGNEVSRVLDISEEDEEIDCVEFEKEVEVAPLTVYTALGLKSHTGKIDPTIAPIGDCLSVANDEGKTFAEIADFCEANPQAVFTEPR